MVLVSPSAYFTNLILIHLIVIKICIGVFCIKVNTNWGFPTNSFVFHNLKSAAEPMQSCDISFTRADSLPRLAGQECFALKARRVAETEL